MLPENPAAGYALLFEAYDQYCLQARARQEEPITFLSYIACYVLKKNAA